ncbi:MAG: transposase [Limnoraphis sp.]
MVTSIGKSHQSFIDRLGQVWCDYQLAFDRYCLRHTPTISQAGVFCKLYRSRHSSHRQLRLLAWVSCRNLDEFRRQLEYKCKLYGSELVIVDRWFPSSKTCSNCGTIKESLSLSERTFICDDCHFELDRDLNAARNLAALAGSLPVSACGVVDADITTSKQEQNEEPR